MGLSLATLIATQSGVQHAFWVMLASLSVLRSNVLSTGQTAFQAMAGTVVGFVVGAALLAAIGTNPDVLAGRFSLSWCSSSGSPQRPSHSPPGRAVFTLTLVILFNIIQPGRVAGRTHPGRGSRHRMWGQPSGGHHVLAPGAGPAFGQALAEAYRDTARYLRAAVEFGMGRCDMSTPERPGPSNESVRAAAASRRLDDAYRGYLAERGAKSISMADATTLLNGVAGLRLAGDAVHDLWRSDDCMAAGDRAQAKAQLAAMVDRVAGWYDRLAASLGALGAGP